MSILIVLAKAPVAGRVKTRLCPPLSGEQAANIALAALKDTLRAVAAVPADHHILVLDGEPGDWVPEGFVVIPQKLGLLDQRLIDAFNDVFTYVGSRKSAAVDPSRSPTDNGGQTLQQKTEHHHGGEPCVLIAMDTPQVHPSQLSDALAKLADADSVIGMAEDGGFWLIGLNAADPAVFRDIPMSVDFTGAAQLERLQSLGHRVATIETLRDIDAFADLDGVAAEFPQLEVSQTWIAMQRTRTT
jgi:uncharacterized protein